MATVATPAEVASPAVPPSSPRAEILRRADGLELIGRAKDSGFREPPLIARRADGQVVQLTDLLYFVAEAADGHRDLIEIAGAVTFESGKTVTPENVRFLADKHLRPLGVLALADGTTPELDKRIPLMALRHRKPLLPESVVNVIARAFSWLHLPPIATVVLLALAAFDLWLFGIHGIAGGLRAAIYDPVLLLAVFASVVVGTAFHEFGHASACRYGGARPGPIGVGFYVVYPAFYCDVTDAYRLNRSGRLRTDLGGVYFNGIFALIAGGVYFLTGQEAALLVAVLQHVLALQQLLPLLRFDGYYVMTDMTGVPDILSRIKPIFRSLVRGTAREPRVAELKPWVRWAVTAYLAALIPALAFLLITIIMGAPRLLATTWDSLGLQFDRLGEAPGAAAAAVGVLRITMLVLPVAATSLSIGRTGKMAGRGLLGWSRASTGRRFVAAVGAVAVVGAMGYVWWPNGDYEPIRPGERGTVGEVIAATSDLPGGRPGFTPERAAEFGATPTVRETEAVERSGSAGSARAMASSRATANPRPTRPAHPGTVGRRTARADPGRPTTAVAVTAPAAAAGRTRTTVTRRPPDRPQARRPPRPATARPRRAPRPPRSRGRPRPSRGRRPTRGPRPSPRRRSRARRRRRRPTPRRPPSPPRRRPRGRPTRRSPARARRRRRRRRGPPLPPRRPPHRRPRPSLPDEPHTDFDNPPGGHPASATTPGGQHGNAGAVIQQAPRRGP